MHNFEEHTYKSPTKCDSCRGFLLGLKNQGYRCRLCKQNLHKKCLANKDIAQCISLQPEHLQPKVEQESKCEKENEEYLPTDTDSETDDDEPEYGITKDLAAFGWVSVQILETAQFDSKSEQWVSVKGAGYRVSFGNEDGAEVWETKDSPRSSTGNNHKSLVWDLSTVYKFACRDVSAELNIVLFRNQTLKPRKAVGVVIVPVKELFRNVTLDQWFEFYPIHQQYRRTKKFRPAAPTISKSGMSDSTRLGFVRIVACWTAKEIQISPWRFYYKPITAAHTNSRKRGTVKDTMQAFSELRRDYLRIKLVRNYVRENILDYPQNLIRHVRTWDDPVLSLGYNLAVVYGFIFAPYWQYPLLAFAIFSYIQYADLGQKHLCMNWQTLPGKAPVEGEETKSNKFSRYFVKRNTEKEDQSFKRQPEDPSKFIIWNRDILDPSKSLNLIQKSTKASREIQLVEQYAGGVADVGEKIINALNGADPDATFAIQMVFFSFCLGFSIVLFIYSWFPTFFSTLFAIAVLLYSSPVVANFNSTTSSSNNMIKQLLLNLWARVPTLDEMGHRYIARQQMVNKL